MSELVDIATSLLDADPSLSIGDQTDRLLDGIFGSDDPRGLLRSPLRSWFGEFRTKYRRAVVTPPEPSDDGDAEEVGSDWREVPSPMVHADPMRQKVWVVRDEVEQEVEYGEMTADDARARAQLMRHRLGVHTETVLFHAANCDKLAETIEEMGVETVAETGLILEI